MLAGLAGRAGFRRGDPGPNVHLFAGRPGSWDRRCPRPLRRRWGICSRATSATWWKTGAWPLRRSWVSRGRPAVLVRAGRGRRRTRPAWLACAGKACTAFLLRECGRLGSGSAKNRVTGLRSVLRFLRLEGLVATDLAAAVPPVAGWRERRCFVAAPGRPPRSGGGLRPVAARRAA